VKEFTDVAGVEDLADGCARSIVIGDIPVAIFRLDDHWYAVDDTCLRCGASLAAGTRSGTVVRCGCGWRYDLATGRMAGIPELHIHTYLVKIADARIFVAGV
jgi:nitrite reductase/ring-hydroxylating ferredoxin subunit